MDVIKNIVPETTVQQSRFDLLNLLQSLGCKSLRMKLFAGSMLYTALAIGLISLLNYINLGGSESQAGRAIFMSAVVAFALLALLLFALSNHLAKSSELAYSQAASGDSAASENSAFTSQTSILQRNAADPAGHFQAQSDDFARQAEEAARQAQALAVINSLPQRIFCKDLEGRYTLVNKAFCESLQKQPQAILGKTEAEVLPGKSADDRELIKNAETLEMVIEEPGDDGNRHYTQLMKMPTYDDGKSIIGTQGISWDVTRSKLEEQALLRESDLLDALMNSSSDIIYFKDLESKFIRINTAVHFGFDDPSAVVGKSDFDFFTREHAQPAYDDEQRIIKTGIPLVGIEERETWADKEDTWASTTKTPLYDRNRNIIGTFGITRDISERKRSEEALKKKLAQFQEFVSRVSEGDLTLRTKEDEDTLGLVAESVNKMLDKFSSMLTEVKKHGLSVSSSASQILVAAEEIEVGTQRQTDEITNITSSVEEMAVCMGQISKNAESSADATRRALTTAEKGGHSVRDTSEAMVRINSAVEQTAEKMRTLGKRSTEISEIIDLIKDIAVQTNLLSLNAAIQAAHAGDAGLGFSVVADEIRKLAERSAFATKNVSHLIKGIQSETLEALSAMENGMKEVKSGSVLAEQSRQALQDISEVVEQSVQLIEEISIGSEEQARVTRNLASAMQTISSITMQASAGSHETAQIIHGMVELSENLNQSLSQFHVKEEM
jgi:PAS domain S-box-containing protein